MSNGLKMIVICVLAGGMGSLAYREGKREERNAAEYTCVDVYSMEPKVQLLSWTVARGNRVWVQGLPPGNTYEFQVRPCSETWLTSSEVLKDGR